MRAAKSDISSALLYSGRNAIVLHTKLSACNHEIGQTEERVKPCCVFGKPTVTNLLQTQQVLDGNPPAEPRGLEVEFFPKEEVLHEKVKIYR